MSSTSKSYLCLPRLPGPKPSPALSPSATIRPRSPLSVFTPRSFLEPPSRLPATRTNNHGSIAFCPHARTRPSSRPLPPMVRSPYLSNRQPDCTAFPTNSDGTPSTTNPTPTSSPACVSSPAPATPPSSKVWACTSTLPASPCPPNQPSTRPMATCSL